MGPKLVRIFMTTTSSLLNEIKVKVTRSMSQGKVTRSKSLGQENRFLDRGYVNTILNIRKNVLAQTVFIHTIEVAIPC